MASAYPTYATHPNREVRYRPPETKTDIKELWSQCSAIHAQLAGKVSPLNQKDRLKDQLDLASYQERLQELQQSESSCSARTSSGASASKSPLREDAFSIGKAGDEDILSTSTRSTMLSTSRRSSYSEVKNEIASMLGDFSRPPPLSPDAKDIQKEIAQLLGGSSPLKRTPSRENPANMLDIPPTNLALTQLHAPLCSNEAWADQHSTSGGYPRIAEEAESRWGPTSTQASTEEAIKEVPPLPYYLEPTEDEALQRINFAKVEIAKERKIQARTIEDAALLEERQKREIEMLKVRLENAMEEQRRLTARIAGVELIRSTPDAGLQESLTSTSCKPADQEPRQRLLYASELPMRRRSSVP